MPFVQVDIDKEIEKHCQESPSFAKSWNESREEYKLIGEMISLRKAEKITQSQLTAITGSINGFILMERKQCGEYVLIYQCMVECYFKEPLSMRIL